MSAEDRRPRVKTSKRIDLELLSAEVGTGLCAGDGEIVVADEGTTVTQQQLAEAIKAHVAPPETAPGAPLTDDEITRLRALLNGR